METNFVEPRSLFGGSNTKTPVNRCDSSSKKRRMMGLPNHDIKLENKFDLGELETVHEKVHEKTSMTIDVGKDKSKLKRNS